MKGPEVDSIQKGGLEIFVEMGIRIRFSQDRRNRLAFDKFDREAHGEDAASLRRRNRVNYDFSDTRLSGRTLLLYIVEPLNRFQH